jgi:hypothetical protein
MFHSRNFISGLGVRKPRDRKSENFRDGKNALLPSPNTLVKIICVLPTTRQP